MRRKKFDPEPTVEGDPLRLGVIVRADDRGLAHLTQEFARYMAPQRVLVVDMHDPRFATRDMPTLGLPGPEFYRVDYIEGGGLAPAHVVEDFLTGLTHVYTAETPYDPMLFERARELGVASICHVMPEFDKFTGQPPTLRPSVMWNPTTWRADMLDAEVVPVPAPVAPRAWQRTEARTFVHIIGSRARPDRNGTLAVYEAIRQSSGQVRWILFGQDPAGGLPSDLRKLPNVEYRAGSVKDRWALYDEADVLVAPRRFGGLSLPVLEAAASGVVVVTLDNDPMRDYAAVKVGHLEAGSFESPGGVVDLFDASPSLLADALADLFHGGVDVGQLSDWTYRYAWEHRWPAQVEAMRARIAEVKP